jgi:hypothetical protein
LAHKNKANLHRDTFGFRKLLIFMTRTKLVALDAINKGQVIWSRYFGDDILKFNKIFVVRSATVKYPPLVVAIGIQKDSEVWIYFFFVYNSFHSLVLNIIVYAIYI